MNIVWKAIPDKESDFLMAVTHVKLSLYKKEKR